MASDPIHPLLGFKQANSEPSCSLVGVMPAFDVADVFLNQAFEVLDRWVWFNLIVFRVHKKHLAGYVAICEFAINLKRIPPSFISALVRTHDF